MTHNFHLWFSFRYFRGFFSFSFHFVSLLRSTVYSVHSVFFGCFRYSGFMMEVLDESHKKPLLSLILYYFVLHSPRFLASSLSNFGLFANKQKNKSFPLLYMHIDLCVHFTSPYKLCTIWFHLWNFTARSSIHTNHPLRIFLSVIFPFIVIVVCEFLVAFHVWNKWISVCVCHMHNYYTIYMLVTSVHTHTSFTVNYRWHFRTRLISNNNVVNCNGLHLIGRSRCGAPHSNPSAWQILPSKIKRWKTPTFKFIRPAFGVFWKLKAKLIIRFFIRFS